VETIAKARSKHSDAASSRRGCSHPGFGLAAALPIVILTPFDRVERFQHIPATARPSVKSRRPLRILLKTIDDIEQVIFSHLVVAARSF